MRGKVATKVCAACGGPDKQCGGGDDLDRALIGIAPACPGINPGNKSLERVRVDSGGQVLTTNFAQPVADMREEFDMRRNYMFDRVSKIPNVTAVKPQGAFYVLVNISQLGLTSQNFADRLLSKANVAVVPGAAFGDDRVVRLSYATSIDIIKKGLDRFQDFCRTL